MRVGWFGGTFDPPHKGHLAVARAVVERFRLEHLLVAPTGRQPLKTSQPIASYPHRLAMVERMCAGGCALEASGLDAPREDGSANYTIDALRKLRNDEGESAKLFAVVGADAFLGLRRWRDPEGLLAVAEWIVVSRPSFSLHDLRPLQLTGEQRSRVHLLAEVNEPVSATEVRRRLHEGESCEGLLPPRVLDYIRAHGLYQAGA